MAQATGPVGEYSFLSHTFFGYLRQLLGMATINHVTTDFADPPDFKLAKVKAFPKLFVHIVKAAFPNLKTLQLPGVPEDVAYAAGKKAAESMPRWKITFSENGHIEGVAATKVLKFKDDFVFRFRTSGNGTVVDGRSKSRKGIADLGANARRIAAYFSALLKELPLRSSRDSKQQATVEE